MTERISILLVDDHLIVREGLATLIQTEPDLMLVGEAENGLEAVEFCRHQTPDVILMDLVMPHMNGIDATVKIVQMGAGTQIIALTSYVDTETVQKVLNAGAVGYLMKDVSAEELSAAIRAAHAGQSTLSHEATKALIQPQTGLQKVGDSLTERELEVLALLVPGYTNSQIAENLSISPSTVKNHVSNILSKLGASSRTQAVKLAIQHELVDLSA